MLKFCILESLTCLSVLKQPSKVPYKNVFFIVFFIIIIIVNKKYDHSKQTTSIK